MAALKVDLCSVMHATMLPGKGLGFNHSASLVFSKNAPTTSLLPSLSFRNQGKHNSNYNHNVVLRTSARRPTTLNATLVTLEAGETRTVPSQANTTYQTTVVSVETLVGPVGGVGEVRAIVLDHGGSFSFRNGQYLEVHFGSIKRDFSISSSSGGDTLSLCVRRAEVFPNSVSNYLCNLEAGDTVEISGPHGGKMVLPELQATHIMVSTATGIAPFRSNIKGLFPDPNAGVAFNKVAWLISGADNYSSLLFDNEFTQIQNSNIHHFRYQRALDNSVADSIYESGNEIFALLDAGAYIYFAGSKSMMAGILETFQKIAQERGVVWDDMKAKLIAKGQWRVEVY